MYDSFFPRSCKSLGSKIAYCALCATFTMVTIIVMFWFIGMG